MKNWLKKKLNKSHALYVYSWMLKNDHEVVGQVPKAIKTLAPDFFLCLFVVPLTDGGEYAKAVIKIEIKNIRVMLKYDTGRVHTTYNDMLEECIPHINSAYGLDSFREHAREEIAKLSWLDKFLYL